MRARGLSGEGDSACDAGNSGRVGSAPHAASNAHASNANAVPGQVRVSATLQHLAQLRSPSNPKRPMLVIAPPEDESEPRNVRSSRAESRVAGQREGVRRRRHRINRHELQFLSASESPYQPERSHCAHQVRQMSCDARRSASDTLRFASPRTLVATPFLTPEPRMGPARFSSPTRHRFLAAVIAPTYAL